MRLPILLALGIQVCGVRPYELIVAGFGSDEEATLGYQPLPG